MCSVESEVFWCGIVRVSRGYYVDGLSFGFWELWLLSGFEWIVFFVGLVFDLVVILVFRSSVYFIEE